MCDHVLEFIIPTFLIAQHVSSDTSLIIRSSKTVFAVSGFTYVCGCLPLWQGQATTNVCKTRGCKYSFRAPDDERCVARNMSSNKKRWNNKFSYVVASCWLFLNEMKVTRTYVPSWMVTEMKLFESTKTKALWMVTQKEKLLTVNYILI